MADKIKAFFKQKKAEAKFKTGKLGSGQKLGAASTSGPAPRQPAAARQERQHPSQSAQHAGAAALNRFASQEDGEEARRRRQQAKIKEQARLELEKEKQVDAEIAKVKEVYGEKEEEVVEAPSASGGVYFRCALVGEEACTKEEMRSRIREFLYSQLECGERGLTAVLIIHTCNSPRDRVAAAIDTLGKIVGNILANPAEPKFRKIRKSNKAYQGKVAGLEGTAEFLEGCGFVTRQVEGPEGGLEECWVLPGEETDLGALGTMVETLRGAEPVVAELDRGTRVLPPGEKVDNRLPGDFFAHSGEEVRREQERRSDEVEREGMLRTKAMREREEARGRRKYRYCLIRVRFPDGWLVQGTFAVGEPLAAVSAWVADLLETPLPHQLADSVTGRRFQGEAEDAALVDLGLVPAALLTFCWDAEIEAEVAAAGGQVNYLREDLKGDLRA